MARLAQQLAALAAMSPAQLRDAWQRIQDAEAPRLSPELLRLGIGYRLQEQADKGLSSAAARRLRPGIPAPAREPVPLRAWP